MSFTLAERQAVLFCSCPKNAGNLRQFACYCRQVGLLIAQPCNPYHYSLRFLSPPPLSPRTVMLSSQSALYLNVLFHLRASAPLLSELWALISANSALSPLFSGLCSQIPKLFQIASTLAFVFSSTSISSGHGRANPSLAHFRVASIPIFDPKSCIRAA
jgi:hypothetical protein